MRAAARCSWTWPSTRGSLATKILQQTCCQEDATLLERVSCTTPLTISYTHTPQWAGVTVLRAEKNSIGKEELSDTLRGKKLPSLISVPSWGGILWAASTSVGEVGQKMAQAKVRHRQDRKQVSSLGCKAISTQGTGQGQCGVNSQRCQVGAGVLHLLVVFREQEDLFLSLLGSPRLILWALGSDIIFSRQPPDRSYTLSHHPAVLLCNTPNWVIWWWILVLPAARKHKVDPCLLNHCIPVPSTAVQYVAHCQPSKHLTGRKERWIKAPKERRGLEEGQEGNIWGWCMRSFILF